MRTIRLVTYNIHRSIGNDGLHSPGRIHAVLGEINADIIALQEIELHQNPALDLLNYFAEDYGLTAIAGPTIFKSDAHYGNALLTRLAVEDIRRIDLTIPGREPRGAIDIDVACDGHRIQIVATHLGLHPAERRRQVRKLLSLFNRQQQPDLTVFMGDINEWFLWGRPLRWLKQQFPAALTRRTFPHDYLFLHLTGSGSDRQIAWPVLIHIKAVWHAWRLIICR